MTTQATFYSGAGYETSSEPHTPVAVHESDCWPVHDNAIGTKDQLDNGLHPVIAIGGRTADDGRPLNRTGVVLTVKEGLTEPFDFVVVDIADGQIVRNYVSNITGYSEGSAASWETAPVIGQPVYVDDSAALGAGCTLSMSPVNSTGTLKNPLAGHLFYDQDEYVDVSVGGPNDAQVWPPTWDSGTYEYAVCILLTSAVGELT